MNKIYIQVLNYLSDLTERINKVIWKALLKHVMKDIEHKTDEEIEYIITLVSPGYVRFRLYSMIENRKVNSESMEED